MPGMDDVVAAGDENTLHGVPVYAGLPNPGSSSHLPNGWLRWNPASGRVGLVHVLKTRPEAGFHFQTTQSSKAVTLADWPLSLGPSCRMNGAAILAQAPACG